jgi:predicted DNA binding CopG/RHH family protein
MAVTSSLSSPSGNRTAKSLSGPSAPATCTQRRSKTISDKKENKLKPFPRLDTDEEAERFVETADLSEYDFSGFEPTRFEFEPKAAQLNMRVPQSLLDALKERARHRGIPYTQFIRELMEREISRSDKPSR